MFLQDADGLIMRTPELVEVMKYLKETFPTIERITTYARSKTCAHKGVEDLKGLHEAGLSRILVGIESGYDPVLQFMQKGVTARQHVEGGRKVIGSGMVVVAFVMPGLGGRRWADEHILETTRVLNEIKPQFIRIRSLAIQQNSPLYALWKSGKFEPPSDDRMVEEIKQLVEGMNFNCHIETGQLTNILFEINHHLPEGKEDILNIIRRYQGMAAGERLKFRFERCLDYYLPHLERMGRFDHDLEKLLEEATSRLGNNHPEAERVVEEAILATKQRGIP